MFNVQAKVHSSYSKGSRFYFSNHGTLCAVGKSGYCVLVFQPAQMWCTGVTNTQKVSYRSSENVASVFDHLSLWL